MQFFSKVKTIKNYLETCLNTYDESLLDDDDIFLNPENDKKDIEVEITKGISVVKISTILKALTIYGSVTSHIDSIDVDISDGILQDNSSALPERSDKLPSFPKSSCLSK